MPSGKLTVFLSDDRCGLTGCQIRNFKAIQIIDLNKSGFLKIRGLIKDLLCRTG